MDKITINTYNKISDAYEEETKTFWDRFPSTIISKFGGNLFPGAKVLDVGSGPGRDSLLLKNAGFAVTCLDASEEMVKRTRDKGFESVIADFLKIPFDKESFDGVWSYTTLLHVPKSKVTKALLEIIRILKPGGVFGLGMIEGEEELYRESSGMGLPRYFAYYKKPELENLLTATGFSIIYFKQFKPGEKNYLNFLCKKL